MPSIRRMEDICRGIESAYEEDSLSLRSAKYYVVRIVISQRVFLRKIFRHRKISNMRTARSTSKISFQSNQESSWTISIYKPRTSHYKIKISETILRQVFRKSDTFQNQKALKNTLNVAPYGQTIGGGYNICLLDLDAELSLLQQYNIRKLSRNTFLAIRY